MNPPELDLQADLQLATDAARAAGEILVEAFGRDLPVDFKSAEQPVTDADRAADRCLHDALRGARPGYGWVSEESREERTKELAPTWVVDPLDGTQNYIERRPEFAVCIGLLIRGTPTLGVVYNPMQKRMYGALRGSEPRLDDRRIGAAPPPVDRPVMAVSWLELEDGLMDSFRSDWDLVTVGSTALKMMMVAEGRADAYVSRGRKEAWDLCAGTVIARSAGARVLDLDGERVDWSEGLASVNGLIVVSDAASDRTDDIVRIAAAGDT